MRGLKVCLWISGLALLLGLVALFMPMNWIEAWADMLGAEAFPAESEVFVYVVRAMLATCGLIGLGLVIMAGAPLRYGVLVPFSGAAGVFLSLVCLVVGAVTGLPLLWYLGDFLFLLVLGILILIFWARAHKAVSVEQEVPG